MFRDRYEKKYGYCPLNHLAQALYFDAWEKCSFIVASTIYADASGNDHCEPLCLVAGWWNTVGNWTEFGREWKAFLDLRGIDYLHQTGKAEWKENKQTREAVLNEALGIIVKNGLVSHAFFTPTVDWNAFAADVKTQKGLDKPDCFAWNAFRFVVQIDEWCKEHNFRMPEFVFESSNKKEEDALRDIMSEYGLPEPIFRAKLGKDPDRTVVALQAADFLAYELFRGWKDIVNKNYTERPYLRAFDRVEHQWAWADKAKMDLLIPISAAAHRLDRIAQEARQQAADPVSGT